MQSLEPEQIALRLAEIRPLAPVLDAVAEMRGVHLVGGAVRDLVLGSEPTDFDLTIEGDAAAAAGLLAQRLGGEVTFHERFQTAIVRTPQLTFDLAASRRETYPAPGALPDVTPAPLEDDLARRDFSVNAIATALWDEARGSLSAVPGALEDLDAGRLRVLHDTSFLDDPTRLLRLVRYAVRLDFAVEEWTAQLASAAIEHGALATVSPARLGGELRLLLAEPRAPGMLERAGQLGLARAIHPRFEIPPRERVSRARGLLPPDGRRELLLLAQCCRGFARDELWAWLNDLELEAHERDVVVAAALDAAALAHAASAELSPSELARLMRGAPVEQVAAAGAESASDAATRWLQELRHIRLEIDGRDLRDAGVPEGPDIGLALDSALAAKLDGRCSGRAAELEVALAALGPGRAG